MSETYISAALRRAVIERARYSCEYCGIPEDSTLAPHEPDHVIGEQHGGQTNLDNLAYACFRCNRWKGPNIATLDPQTYSLTPLYNPRLDHWSGHFQLIGATIEALTPAGRGTVMLLRFNDEQRVALRAELIQQGRYMPPQ
jgi:HNH endonuclease